MKRIKNEQIHYEFTCDYCEQVMNRKVDQLPYGWIRTTNLFKGSRQSYHFCNIYCLKAKVRVLIEAITSNGVQETSYHETK